jgi:hypothetical protein
MIVSDAPNCSVTYDSHYDDRNSFIIQATGANAKKILVCLNYLTLLVSYTLSEEINRHVQLQRV